MKKNVINCRKHEFVPGRTLRATVKAVNMTGVLVMMPGGRAVGAPASSAKGRLLRFGRATSLMWLCAATMLVR